MNRLVTATVAAMVSLGTWDHQIEHDDLLECVPRAFGDDLPDGFDIKLAQFTELVLSLDSSFRLKNQGTFAGIATTKGAKFSWNPDSGEEINLTVIRLSAYESPNETLIPS